ncbi:hypothetical protein SAMN04488109_4776 [Chryseolinea serpens]|uniref:DUF4842 domain-containing protein n=1 Tax=Chryseolinea serpens TaxID=947013 RepID=A0A1M5UME1_9BACT|nr:hypothetical protein [Chryseolinea serpens]SHH64107.1 hypothetical protein SAMN04488109_4776 [Chryseolinea serpens]
MNRFGIVALLFSFASVFLSSCSRTEEPSGPQTILTIQVDTDYGLSGDDWVYATDNSGAVLDVKPYADGQTVTLTSVSRPDKINVTFFYAPGDPSERPFFSTWAAIDRGTTLHFETEKTETLQESDATLKISNYPWPITQWMGISNGHGVVASTSSSQSGVLKVDFSFYDAPSDLLLYGYRGEVPVYNWANSVNAGDVVARDFESDFVPFPHTFQLNFEGSNKAEVTGVNSKKTRITLLSTWLWNLSTHPVIGYLDGFDSYELLVMNLNTNGATVYKKNGTIDPSFKIPAFTFSLTNRSVQDFAFNFSEPYTYHQITWAVPAGTEGAWWRLNVPSGQRVGGLVIPAEIAAKYSHLNVDKLQYSYMQFYQFVSGRSYPEGMPGMAVTDAETALEYYVYTPKN